jgi:hypothetical protein
MSIKSNTINTNHHPYALSSLRAVRDVPAHGIYYFSFVLYYYNN